MQHLFSMHTSAHSHNYRQTYVLLLLGFVFLTLAWLGMFNSFSIGVLLLGLGMLVVGLLNPRRFLSAGWLMASLGVVPWLYKSGGTDTGILCCGGGCHRIPAGRTSHAVYCGSFRAFPLAPWIWPLCAWTGFSGCERENIPGGANENKCSSWEYSSTFCERGRQVKRNMQEIQNNKEITSVERINRSGQLESHQKRRFSEGSVELWQ